MSALNNRTPSPRRTLFPWIGLLIYACIVTFPHQFVQDFVSKLTDRYTNERVWAVSVKAAELEGALLILFVAIALFRLRGWVERGWLATYLLLSVFLLFFSWRMFMINNMELVHFPQYFPEGIALIAMTGSAAESLAGSRSSAASTRASSTPPSPPRGRAHSISTTFTWISQAARPVLFSGSRGSAACAATTCAGG